MDRVGLAVVGLGRISVAHLTEIENLREKIDLVAVVSRRGEVAAEVASRYGARRFYGDYAQALADRDIHGVVLCTPHHTHVPMAVQAAESRKHVLVEKPLATSTAEGEMAVATARRHGVNLMVAYNQRFVLGIMEAKKRLEAVGRPTQLVQVRGSFVDRGDRPDWWREADKAGGFALPIVASHAIDTFLWWLGRAPRTVYAETANHDPDWPGEDEVSLSMGFGDGVQASIHVSFNCREGVNERFVFGTKGLIRLTTQGQLWVNGELVASEPVVPYSRGGLSYRRQLEEFADAILQGREPLASARETLPTVRVLEAARLSIAERRPITLAVQPSSESQQPDQRP